MEVKLELCPRALRVALAPASLANKALGRFGLRAWRQIEHGLKVTHGGAVFTGRKGAASTHQQFRARQRPLLGSAAGQIGPHLTVGVGLGQLRLEPERLVLAAQPLQYQLEHIATWRAVEGLTSTA